MRKAILITLIFSLLLAGCGEPRYLGPDTARKRYPSYGVFNEASERSNHVCYEMSIGNVMLGLLLFETVVFPVYIVGWVLYDPIRMKRDQSDDCSFD